MKNGLVLFLLLFVCKAQSQISFSERHVDLETIQTASEIQGDIVVTNTSGEKIYLMRADAERGVKVYTSKKTLLPHDTCLIVISFTPEKAGKFTRNIRLVSSDKPTPYEISLSGNILNVKTNDKQACYYFGDRKNTSAIASSTNPIIFPSHEENYNNRVRDTIKQKAKTVDKEEPKPILNEETELLSNKDGNKEALEVKKDTTSLTDEFVPNNILFLVDVSGSMRDSLKLPVMKMALHRLIDAVRDVDTISLVTYASVTKVLAEAISGADKRKLHTVVDSLKSKGATGGKKAIMMSQVLLQKHFIEKGNNQILLASDGIFEFELSDFMEWKRHQEKKYIVMSTVAFGNDSKAIRNLKGIAAMCGGSFIHINTRKGSEEKLLDEVKMRSRKKK